VTSKSSAELLKMPPVPGNRVVRYGCCSSDLTVMDKMYPFSFGHEFHHVLGAVIALQGAPGKIWQKHVPKTLLLRHEARDILTVVLEVGRKEEIRAGHHVAFQELDECAVYQASFPVPFFRPGVGTVDIYGAERIFRDLPGYEFPCLDPQNTDIR